MKNAPPEEQKTAEDEEEDWDEEEVTAEDIDDIRNTPAATQPKGPIKPSLKLGKTPLPPTSTQPTSGETTANPAPEATPPESPTPEPQPPESSPIKLRIVEAETVERVDKLPVRNEKDYQFPTLDLLTPPQETDPAISEAEHQETAMDLLRTFESFKVNVELGDIQTGPVITRYEVLPAPGVQVKKIVSLEQDIALNLKAMAVRIQAPVPGKGCVGIEVPNRKPSAVYLRDIIESRDWANNKADIPLALGKEVNGKPLVSDLARMPHLLIAGATGSGKTVCINSIIASLLYHSSPKDLRFIMVDPKIVEMKVYNDLPHMLIPVVTEPKKVPGALKWLIREMERRYRLFSEVGVRNIAGYKKKFEEGTLPMDKLFDLDPSPIRPEPGSDLNQPENIPYIVAIIDELADLMMVAQADIETGIARLAQLARAAGIHLIIATQRPSVNVITGVIKANLPSRIAFQVSSKVDSRTILDAGGAESLIGRGDMLFNPPGSGRLLRSQGAFVSDEEINELVEFLKRNGPPAYAEEVQREIESSDEDDSDSAEDDNEDVDGDEALLRKSMDVLRTSRRASTSMLQRRLRIGYNRAARIMDLLEDRGIVGPDKGNSQPRDILVDLDD